MTNAVTAGTADPRTPVLVGVGTASDDVEAAELMALATRAAAADATADDGTATALLAAVDQIAVPRGTWSYTDPARIVAERIGAPTARTVLVELGIPQQSLINDALAGILDGRLDVAVVVGAEAKARAARAARRSMAADADGIRTTMRRDRPGDGAAPEIDQHGAAPDVFRQPAAEIIAQPEIDARLYAPVEQYALIDSALRAADGVTVDEHRRQIAELWARFNAVAAGNQEAAFPAPMSADELRELGPANRPLAFPYGKWHATQWTVDQGAALVLCSVAAAERLGVPRRRWLFPLAGLESSAAVPLTQRAAMHRWPAMGVLGRAAAGRLGRPLRTCDHVELYSCFPAAVRVQQRELGLPLDGTPTVTGGMAFAGGPFNSFVFHATAAIARRLRSSQGVGLVTTVSGMLTKPGLALWSTAHDGEPPLIAELGDAAAATTETVDVLGAHYGPATVAACTVTYDGQQPRQLVAILDIDGGARVIARSTDTGLVARATAEELVGQRLTVAGNAVVAAIR